MANNLEIRVKELEECMKKVLKQINFKINKKLSIGDSFELCDLKWTILDINKKGYVCLADSFANKMTFSGNSNDWRKSSLRKYLNETLYEKLKDKVGEENIFDFERDLLSLDGQTEYGKCTDKVSLLTVDEYRKYRNLIPNVEDYWWWLISPWSTPCNNCERSVTVVSPSGNISSNYCDYSNGVRPFCIFSSSIFES